MSKLTERLEGLFEPLLKSMGLSVVRILIMGSGQSKLQLMIERTDNTPVSMEDCVKASHEISNLLDIEDPIDSSYVLEVTSPGLDRPLVKLADFHRFQGEVVNVTVFRPQADGRRKYRGTLCRADDDAFDIDLMDEDGIVTIAYADLGHVKLDPEIKFKKG